MDSIKEIQSTTERVERILKEDDRARNDYKWLLYRVYQEVAHEQGSNIFIPFEIFNKLPSPETVSRCSRHIQNDQQKYVPDESTGINRCKKQNEYHAYYGGQKWIKPSQ